MEYEPNHIFSMSCKVAASQSLNPHTFHLPGDLFTIVDNPVTGKKGF